MAGAAARRGAGVRGACWGIFLGTCGVGERAVGVWESVDGNNATEHRGVHTLDRAMIGKGWIGESTPSQYQYPDCPDTCMDIKAAFFYFLRKCCC